MNAKKSLTHPREVLRLKLVAVRELGESRALLGVIYSKLVSHTLLKIYHVKCREMGLALAPQLTRSRMCYSALGDFLHAQKQFFHLV